jgi:hypothetical protein
MTDQAGKQQKAFEKWWDIQLDGGIQADDTLEYVSDDEKIVAWAAWQAALSAQQPTTAKLTDAEREELLRDITGATSGIYRSSATIGQAIRFLDVLAPDIERLLAARLAPLVEAVQRARTELAYIVVAPTPELRKSAETELALNEADVALARYESANPEPRRTEATKGKPR